MRAYESLNQFFLYAVFFVFVWCWAGCAKQEDSFTEPSNSANGMIIEQFTTLMNEHRVSVGCEPLEDYAALADVAQEHSEDMSNRKYFNHMNPEGKTPFDRIALANIDGWTSAAENIEQNSGDVRSVLDVWLNSAGHKANIENCAYTHHGVGVADGYWTHMFISKI